jgi:Putative inner membrane protein (DUF1819)
MSDGGNIGVDCVHRLKAVHRITDTPCRSRYALSFTSGALLMREALIAAPIYLREHDWAKVRQLIEEDNLLQSRTVSTGRRFAREVAQRLPSQTSKTSISPVRPHETPKADPTQDQLKRFEICSKVEQFVWTQYVLHLGVAALVSTLERIDAER